MKSLRVIAATLFPPPEFLISSLFFRLKLYKEGDSRKHSSKLNQVNSRTISVFIFLSVIHFEFILVSDLRHGSNFIFFQRLSSFPHPYLLKSPSLPQCLEMLLLSYFKLPYILPSILDFVFCSIVHFVS